MKHLKTFEANNLAEYFKKQEVILDLEHIFLDCYDEFELNVNWSLSNHDSRLWRVLPPNFIVSFSRTFVKGSLNAFKVSLIYDYIKRIYFLLTSNDFTYVQTILKQHTGSVFFLKRSTPDYKKQLTYSPENWSSGLLDAEIYAIDLIFSLPENIRHQNINI